MEKNERYARYKYLTGLSSWEIASYQDSNFKIFVNDGPCGLRKPIHQEFTNQEEVYQTVCFLAPCALAASFDKNLCYENATLLAKECLYHKTNILLAPGVNIKRYVLCGRNFEYFSEDPFLAGLLAASYINGLEDNNVGACIKHYACNSQEHARTINSSEVSLRALNEIYLRVFKYALKYSNPTSLMTSYNKINGKYINEDKYLIQKKLRNEYNFQGLIVSDWGAVSNKHVGINVGVDVEMPQTKMSDEYIDRGYGKVFDDNDLIARDNEIYNAIKKFKNTNYLDSLDLDNLHNKAVDLAKKTMVLVKNENNYLPFKKTDKVLVLGHLAKYPYYVGDGSGFVYAYKVSNFLDVLKNNNVSYDFEECYDSKSVLIDKETLLKYQNKYDKVILFMGLYSKDDSEGHDRNTLELCENQRTVLEYVKEVFEEFASVVVSGSVVNIEKVYQYSKALMISYLAGEAQEDAIFANIFGLHNPSGRLPETWISSLKQNPINKEYLRRDTYHTYYYDDIYVGYRYYDTYDVKGFMLPFGYGLSYCNFKYNNFKYEVDNKTNKVIISLDVTNTSNIDGEDVIQIYVNKENSAIYRPKKELKGFEKVFVKTLSTSNVKVTIDIDDLKSYRDKTDSFELEDGNYTFMIALNVTNIIDTKTLNLAGIKFEEVKEPVKLNNVEICNDYTLDTPGGALFDNEVFKKYAKEHNLPFDLDNFEEKYWFIDSSPLRSLSTNYNITFEQLEDMINYLNKYDVNRKLNQHINYDKYITSHVKLAKYE